MLNIVIPMAGAGTRFKIAGYSLPKPFIDVKGKMMIERVLEGVKFPHAHYHLIIQEEFLHSNKKELEELCNKFQLTFITVEKLTQGASCTALASHKIINNDSPVVFIDSDTIIDNLVFNNFVLDILNRNLDGGVLTFSSNKDCYSYVKTDEQTFVTCTKEKEVISNHAIAGAYIFSKGTYFVDCAINMMIYGDKVQNEYYMSNVYNYAIRKNLKIGIFHIDNKDFACVGTPKHLEEYLNIKD